MARYVKYHSIYQARITQGAVDEGVATMVTRRWLVLCVAVVWDTVSTYLHYRILIFTSKLSQCAFRVIRWLGHISCKDSVGRRGKLTQLSPLDQVGT